MSQHGGVCHDRPLFCASLVECSAVLPPLFGIKRHLPRFVVVVVGAPESTCGQVNCSLKHSSQASSICCLSRMDSPFLSHTVSPTEVRRTSVYGMSLNIFFLLKSMNLSSFLDFFVSFSVLLTWPCGVPFFQTSFLTSRAGVVQVLIYRSLGHGGTYGVLQRQ